VAPTPAGLLIALRLWRLFRIVQETSKEAMTLGGARLRRRQRDVGLRCLAAAALLATAMQRQRYKSAAAYEPSPALDDGGGDSGGSGGRGGSHGNGGGAAGRHGGEAV